MGSEGAGASDSGSRGGGIRAAVRFELSARDVAPLYSQAFLRHPRRHRLFAVVLLAGPFFGVLAGLMAGPVAGIGLCLLTWLMTAFSIACVRKMLPRQPLFRGPHVVWIAPEAFGLQTEGMAETTHRWRELVQLRETDGELLLDFRRGPPSVMIPKCAFLTPQSASDFLACARKWHAEATRPRRALGMPPPSSELTPAPRPLGGGDEVTPHP